MSDAKTKLLADLKNKDLTEIVDLDLSGLDMKGLDFSGKTLKGCNITKADFINCAGLPKLIDCTSGKTKVTSITIVRTAEGQKVILSMVRAGNPFYLVGKKEIPWLSRERESIDAIRRL